MERGVFHACSISLYSTQGRIHRGGGGQGGHAPPGGHEVPQLKEGSETYQPKVKASKYAISL